MIDQNHLITVAKITGFHGLQGFVKIRLFAESMAGFQAFGTCLAKADEGIKPLVIEKVRQQGQGIVVKFRGVDDRTQAETLGKCALFIEESQLPALATDEYYWRDLIGLQVISGEETLGRIDHLFETGSNDVFVVKPTEDSLDDRERCLPYRPEVVKQIDLETGKMTVDWDTGF